MGAILRPQHPPSDCETDESFATYREAFKTIVNERYSSAQEPPLHTHTHTKACAPATKRTWSCCRSCDCSASMARSARRRGCTPSGAPASASSRSTEARGTDAPRDSPRCSAAVCMPGGSELARTRRSCAQGAETGHQRCALGHVTQHLARVRCTFATPWLTASSHETRRPSFTAEKRFALRESDEHG